jgi:hypothetical protein
MIRFFTLALCSLGISLGIAQAQLSADLVIPTNNINPYETLKVTVQSYSFDVDNALLTWKVNGVTVRSSVGEKTLNVTLGGPGTKTTVELTARDGSGEEIGLSRVFSPQSVTLLWESPESYTPPFYKGKALPGEGAAITVTAFPEFFENNKRIPATNLSYAWYVHGEFVQSASGRGKSTFTTSLDYLRNEHIVKVIVRSESGSQSENSVTIRPHAVMPLFYTHDTILGPNTSYGFIRRFETTKEVTLYLAPYYLSTKGTPRGSERFSWTLNGLPITQSSLYTTTLRPKDDSYGAQTLVVSIDQLKRKLQKTEARVEIVFDSRK